MSEGPPDYYAILHVDSSAPVEIIRASYRTLMQRLRAHPDLGGDHEAAASLNAAYAVLRDPRKRAEYDVQREIAASGPASQRKRSSAARTGATQTHKPARTSEPMPERGQESQSSTGIWMNAAGAPARVEICPFCAAAATSGRHGSDTGTDCRVCAGPLTLAMAVRHDGGATQRAIHRIAKAEPLRVYVSPQDRTGVEALIHDVSLTGMRFSCSRRFEGGDLVRAECEFCAAVARIAYVSELDSNVWQYGAEFVTVRFARQRGSLLSVPV